MRFEGGGRGAARLSLETGYTPAIRHGLRPSRIENGGQGTGDGRTGVRPYYSGDQLVRVIWGIMGFNDSEQRTADRGQGTVAPGVRPYYSGDQWIRGVRGVRGCNDSEQRIADRGQGTVAPGVKLYKQETLVPSAFVVWGLRKTAGCVLRT